MKLMPYVKKLEGRNSLERKKIITDILDRMGVDYDPEEYDYFGYSGENIIITLGRGRREILVVTHYDSVPGSPGANDNASTIAVVFDVLRRLKGYKPKHKLKFIIFGHEEDGCVGSGAYVKKHGIANIDVVYNMELVGMGNMFGIWPVTREVEYSPALKNLKSTIEEMGHYYEEAGELPLFFGDYRPFRKAGLMDAFCLTVLPKEDKKGIRRFVEMPRWIAALRVMFGLIKVPRFFQLYHSPEDKSKYLSERALQMTSDVLFHAVVNMDKG